MKPTTKDALNLLMQGSMVLARMEHHGIAIDEAYLEKTISEVSQQITQMTGELKQDEFWRVWRKRWGEKANIGSDHQLTTVLFDVLKLPYPEGEEWRTHTGRYRADEEMIGRLKLPFCKSWRRLKKLQRLRGTYLHGIRREVLNGRVHASAHLHTVETYRSSYSDPNLQNAYNRDPEMKDLLRRCYVPSEGCVLVEVDFSTIEVRVGCARHKDPTMMEYMRDASKDMHRDTAAELYSLPVKFLIEHKDWAKKHVRDWSKNRFVFPQFYGSVWFQCAPDLWEQVAAGALMPDGETTVKAHLKSQGIKKLGRCKAGEEPEPGSFGERVREVEKSFWDVRFPVYTAWKKKTYENYLECGYIDTLTGFRLAGHYRRNEVLNSDIQGSSFHCLLWSMIEIVNSELRRRRMKARLVAEIHDSMLIDAPIRELQDILHIAKEVMIVRLPKAWSWINVPMETESEICEENWAGKVVWVENNGIWGPK